MAKSDESCQLRSHDHIPMDTAGTEIHKSYLQLCKGLELGQPIPNGRIWGVMVTCRQRGPCTTTELYAIPTSPHFDVENLSTLGTCLGFGLNMRKSPYNPAQYRNLAVEHLFLNGNLVRGNGHRLDRPPPEGDILLTRSDAKDLHVDHVKCLLEYLGDIVRTLEKPEAHPVKWQMVSRKAKRTWLQGKLSPAAFHAFYKEWCRWEVERGNEGVRKIISPVRVGNLPGMINNACGYCGSQNPATRFIRCDKCHVRLTCSTECREADVDHRLVCDQDD